MRPLSSAQTLVAALFLATAMTTGGALLMPPVAMAAHGGNGGGNGGENGGGHGGAGANAGEHGTSGNASGAAAGAHGANAAAASSGQLASALGALNAAHASPTALAHAAPNSKPGQLAAYDNAMLSALAMPDTTTAQVAARQAAIAAARTTLAATTNKTLTPSVVQQVDLLLGLPPTDRTLGVTSPG